MRGEDQPGYLVPDLTLDEMHAALDRMMGAPEPAPPPAAPRKPGRPRSAKKPRTRLYEVRGKTIDLRRQTKMARDAARLEFPDDGKRRLPMTRGECVDGVRPCPYVSCRHHLYLDVAPNGNIKLNFPDLEVDQMLESCVLDAADRGGLTLEETADVVNLTRERVRQIEQAALDQVAVARENLEEYL